MVGVIELRVLPHSVFYFLYPSPPPLVIWLSSQDMYGKAQYISIG
jgi:hypothetical protein